MGNLKRILGMTTAKALVLTLSLTFLSTAQAASISYGNFGPVPPGITFLDVTESSGTDAVPLYGPPSPFATGLDFNPSNFVAFASGGASDVTDGQLNFTLAATSDFGITDISLFEAGDYTLAGLGGPPTQVFAGAILRATVTEINGLVVAPIVLAPANASAGFNLPPTQIVQPWGLGVSLNVAGQLGVDQRATKVDVVIDNQLLATSELSSISYIAKKEFLFRVNSNATDLAAPEPATWVLATISFGALLLVAKRRKTT